MVSEERYTTKILSKCLHELKFLMEKSKFNSSSSAFQEICLACHDLELDNLIHRLCIYKFICMFTE